MKMFATTALGAIALTGVAMSVATPAQADGAIAKHDLVLSLGLLTDGNFNAARSYAEKAIKADPKWGLAHAMLARTYLALGDGIGAEAELGRAAANGFNMTRGHQMLAQAWLLQGDAKRALAEAAKADPRFGGYAARVTAKALALQNKSPDAIALLGELLNADPGNSYGWSDLARIRYNTGDVAGAAANAQRAVALDPNNLEALTLRGELMREQYGLGAALPWFEGALKRDAYYYPALIEYAATLGDMGRYNDMLDATRKALAAQPGNPQALYLQAVLAARAQNYDLARGLMQRTGGAVDDLPGGLLLGGTLDYQAGAYEQAIDKWRELVGRQPMNVTARRLLGAALLRSGDAKGALDVLRPVALRGDADSYTLALVGRAFEANGERDWAAKYLDRAAWPATAGATPFGSDDGLAVLANAAANDPGNPVAMVGMIRGLIDAGQASNALDRAKALAAASPGAPAAHLLVGDTLMTMSRYGEAADAYRRAADIKFDEATMLRAVDALDNAGRRPEASRVLALFLGQHPENIPALRLAAHWQIAAGDWDGAIGTLEDLRSRVGSRDVGLLAELAYANIGAQNVDDALDYGAAAYEIAPMSPAATDAYGWAFYAAGDSDKAKDLLEKAALLAPRQAGIRWHLAQAYADLGRNAEAKAQIALALGDPSFAERAPAQALLKTLG
ncbi:tetratricopeptide repeat protein [Sphingomonas panacisoli]|uniref:Tetratricopeptide repeat protein n=1 Tax=Sphingomonas panacisoli TaxID=1813879 RepID=A0A5B8LG94_9SPHN|nr:tetratricopeptide repeat protein [Sphingomonas panacisoli]QDZ06662.1 tetratricopeptide repeat protein [Sphingomonas panacisoli]